MASSDEMHLNVCGVGCIFPILTVYWTLIYAAAWSFFSGTCILVIFTAAGHATIDRVVGGMLACMYIATAICPMIPLTILLLCRRYCPPREEYSHL